MGQHAPLNVAGVHAAIERIAPGEVAKGSVAATVSDMLSKGLLVAKGTDGRGRAVALKGGAR